MKLKIIAIAHHRNGVRGTPFDVVLFRQRGSRMFGIVFDEPDYCAVLNVDLLAAGDIAFESNSWRADEYEPHLRKVIKQYQAKEEA